MSDAMSTPEDFSKQADAGMVHNYITRHPKRWAGLSEEVKAIFLRGMVRVAGIADSMMDSPETTEPGVAAMLSAAKVAVLMEGQNQADEHLDAKHAREDAGAGPTVTMKLYGLSSDELKEV